MLISFSTRLNVHILRKNLFLPLHKWPETACYTMFSTWIRSDQRRSIAAMCVCCSYSIVIFQLWRSLECFTLSSTQQLHFQKSDLTINRAGLVNAHFPVLTEFKSLNVALWVMNYSPSYNLFPADKSLLTSRYVTGIFVTDVKGFYILCSPVRTFTARTRHDTCRVSYSIGRSNSTLIQILPQNS